MKAFTVFSSILALATVAVAAQAPAENEIEARSPLDNHYWKRASGTKAGKKIGGGGGDDEEEGQNSTAISITPGWRWVGAGVVLTGLAITA